MSIQLGGVSLMPTTIWTFHHPFELRNNELS